MRSLKRHKRGFTIVELVVVMGIFAGLASVVLFQFSDFSSNITLQNLAQQIAVQVKKAQTQGSLGQSPDLFFGTTPSFGVHFDVSNQNADSFFYFADRDGNKSRTGTLCGGTAECLDEIVINTSDRITQLCVNDCKRSVDELHITYKRPNLTATFVTASPQVLGEINNAWITIESSKGDTKKIIVEQIGQIRIE